MWLLLYLWGCLSDHYLTFEKSTNQIEYIYVQDNYIEGSSDTGEVSPIWVDSFEQPKLSNGVDIIWVIDSSGSMQDDQARIIQGIVDMMGNLPQLNWRLMIISMTPHNQISVSSFPLLPGDDTTDALAMFNSNVNGSGENGFESLYNFIELNSFAHQWLRPDAALLAVFVSDEDDNSVVAFPMVSLYSDWLRTLRSQVSIASIINLWPEDSLCNLRTNDVGQRYIELTNMFNGNIIDICSEDWSQGVAEATSQLQLNEWWELTMIPSVESSITVFVDGVVWTDWEYNQSDNKVYFLTVPPEESLVEIAYYY